MSPPLRPGRWPIADFAFAAGVLAIIGTLLVPVSPAVLDALIAFNLGAAVVVLLVALHATEPVAVSTLPTVILVSTLYRLALDVAAARLILGRADAGAVIRSFGAALMRGNVVVGGVTFAMISLVQYVVIARGASRVAEVTARFALDALPGRQLAIDAELRNGSIDPGEAQRQRATLGRESRFYGAMDGALRFVRGDAVAGLVIVAIDLVGGVSIGVFQRGMSPAAAIARYGALTVGQGLVAQVPALMSAVAAGIVVTRVSGGDSRSLGTEVASQFAAQPKALWFAAATLGLLSVVPGMPFVPFALLGAACALGAYKATGSVAARPMHEQTRSPRRRIVPFGITVGARHAALATPGGPIEGMAGEAVAMLERESGVTLPRPVITVASEDVDGDTVRVEVFEVPAVSLRVEAGEHAVTTIVEAMCTALRAHLGSFVGIPEARVLLDDLTLEHPALVRELVPRTVTLPMLAGVLRALVSEGIPVRNLRAVVEALGTAAAAGERDVEVLAEGVRGTMQREITWRHAPDGKLAPYVVAPEIEEAVRDAARRSSAGPLQDAGLAEDVRDAARRAMEGQTGRVVLTSGDVRRWIRRMLAPALPGVVVLAYNELEPGVMVKAAGRITP